MVALVPSLIALGLLFVPGLVIGAAARLQLRLWLALAPAFSMTSVAIASTLGPFVHVSWGLPLYAVVTAALAVLVGLIRWWLGRRWPERVRQGEINRSWRLNLWFIGAIAIAAIAISARLMVMIGDPQNFSQTYDDIFHLNAVRYVMETGNASSLTLGGLKLGDLSGASFYPSVWHALTALTAMLSGASIPLAVNAMTLVMCAVVWPVGALILAQMVNGSRKFVFIATGILSAGFLAFPYLMVDYGVLFPFTLALAVLSPAVALMVTASGYASEPVAPRVYSSLLLALAIPGIALAHTSVLMTLVTMFGPIVLLAMIAIHRRLKARKARASAYWLLYGSGVVLLALVGMLFMKLGPGNMWEGREPIYQALLELFMNGPFGYGPAIAVSVCVIVGLVVSLRARRNTWLLINWALFALMFLMGATVKWSFIRSLIIGMWYGDVQRIAAMLAIIALPIAVTGAVWMSDRLGALIRRATKNRGGMRILAPLVSALLLVIIAADVQTGNVNGQTAVGHTDYSMTPDSPLITPDEFALLNEVDQFVPEGITVGGTPWTGTSLVYAIANRPALLMHVLYETADDAVIIYHLQHAAKVPELCPMVQKFKMGYVLDFGLTEVHGQRHIYPGFENMDKNPSVELVKRIGGASLWKVTACGDIVAGS